MANWTNEGAAYCESCVSKQLQRDTNGCSGTYNQTRVINSGSACDTSQSWVNSGSYNCYGTCNNYNVEVQNNPCASGYNTTRQGSLVASNSTDCGGCCGQSTSANWTNEGAAYCVDCVSYQNQRDTNGCSGTYNQTRSINSGSACDTAQNWVNSGSYDCYGTCNKYNIEIQNNPCASGYNTTRQGSLVESDSTFCGGCCGQSTSANWVNESTDCDGFTLYNVQRDTNSCSATYNQTRRGSDIEYNSPSCGYIAPTPTPTATPVPTVFNINVINSSLNLPITGVEVDGINVSHLQGSNFPLISGENGIFQTTFTGTKNIRVYYGSHISGQNISVMDSNLTITCYDTNGSSGYVDTSIEINSSGEIYISVQDGACQ